MNAIPRPLRARFRVLALVLAAAAAPGAAGGTEIELEAGPEEIAPGAPSEGARQRARETELETIRRSLDVSKMRQQALAREIRTIEADRARLKTDLIDTARRLQATEREIADIEARLDRLHANEDAIRASLFARRAVLAEVLAALQRMGRTPPPALVSRADDALGAIRGSILAVAVLPGIRVEAEALAADLKELNILSGRIGVERDRLKTRYASLGEERARTDLLISSRNRRREETEASLFAERNKAARLAGEAKSLEALIGAVEAEASETATAAAEAADPQDSTSPGDAAARLSDASRLAPAISFADARGLLPMPVSGTPVLRFGEDDGLGGIARGLSIEAVPGGRVVSPADAWVVYAGAFRSFGQVLILNAGDGYHIVLAGIERIDVNLGQFVLAGEPVAVMGTRRLASLGDLDHASAKAVLYVEFRKDNVAIDPQPWWDERNGNEVRG